MGFESNTASPTEATGAEAKIISCLTDKGPQEMARLLDENQLDAANHLLRECFVARTDHALMQKQKEGVKITEQVSADTGLKVIIDLGQQVSGFDKKGVNLDLEVVFDQDQKYLGTDIVDNNRK